MELHRLQSMVDKRDAEIKRMYASHDGGSDSLRLTTDRQEIRYKELQERMLSLSEEYEAERNHYRDIIEEVSLKHSQLEEKYHQIQ